jgi:hypothetical protein
VRITRPSHGDVRYLGQAMRITERTVRMAADLADREAKRDAKRAALTPTRSVSEGTEVTASAEFDSRFPNPDPLAAAAPPDRACSPQTEIEPPLPEALPAPAAPTDCGDTTCDEVEDRRREFLAALKAESDPVQLPVLERKAAARNSRRLNRKERRARQRRLEQAMRRGK